MHSEELATLNPAGAAFLIGLGRVGFVNVFMFRHRVRRRLPKGDAVRNVSVRGKGIFSFNQRGSEIAKQHQSSEESESDSNGLKRYKDQHESTSGD